MNAVTEKPVRSPVRRSEALREQIEERIAMGFYAPGRHLDEVELAEEFGVSRTPIREAFLQLSASGLIDMQPRKGAFVASVPFQRLWEMFEVMAELEATCARLAARHMQPAECEELRQAHQACATARDAGNTDAYYKLNETFHHLIYAASRNGFLAEQASSLHRRLRPFRRLQLRVRDRMQTSDDEHAAVVQAICLGDSDLAADLLREHVRIQGQRFSDLMASLTAQT
jgi:DNA-binding GntR family transcriptional regulator